MKKTGKSETRASAVLHAEMRRSRVFIKTCSFVALTEITTTAREKMQI